MISSYVLPQYRYIQRCRRELDDLDLKGRHVLVIGGTQGIGAAVARRFAELKCKVSIAGRSEDRGNSVLFELNLANPGSRGKFYKVDLSSMKEVERFTDEVIKDVKDRGVDYLILSAGGPPTGHWRNGPEGLEKAFAVQCLSRFYATYRLLPAIKQSVIVIAAPGRGAFYDETDPGFEKPENRKKMTMIRQARRDSLFLDAVFKEFSVRNPKITFYHIFPGLVYTNTLENQGFHPAIVGLGRFYSSLFATAADKYANIPVANAVTDGGGGLITQSSWGWKRPIEAWAENPSKRKWLFEWALQRAQTAAKQPESQIEPVNV